jgi:hypothetical protein
MSDIKNTAQDLFDLLKSRFQHLRARDKDSKNTADPDEMRVFTFTYRDSERDLGDVTISIVDPQALKVLFSKSMLSGLNPEAMKNWYQFVRELKEFAKRNLLMFDIRDITSSQLSTRAVKTHADINKPRELDSMTESRLTGTSRSSYQKLGPVTIVVRHSAPVNPEVSGSRSRNIDRIYLENSDGERFKLNFCHMPAARAMANHIRRGGSVQDDVAQYITNSVNEMKDLARFVRYIRRNQFSDPATGEMATAACDRYAGLRTDLLELASARRYDQARDRCIERHKSQSQLAQPTEQQLAELKNRFSKMIFRSQLESALPRVFAAYEQYQREPLELTEFLERQDLALGLREDDLANLGWKVQKFSNNRTWASRCLEDLSERLTEPRFRKIAEFAKTWSKQILESDADPVEQQLAVKLTSRYISELRSLGSDPEYSEIAQCSTLTEQNSPDLSDPGLVRRFQKKFSEPIPLGRDATNAILAIQDFVQDNELNKRLISLSRDDLESDLTGPGQDARPAIADWMRDNQPGLYDLMNLDDIMAEPEDTAGQEAPPVSPAPAPAPPAPAPAPAPPAVAESDDLLDLKKILERFRN